MSRLFRRVWAVEVAGRRSEGLTVHFGARYPGRGEPAQCDVRVFMPPREMVAALYSPGTECRVLAGYVDTGAVEVFAGVPIPGSVEDARQEVSWQLSASRTYAARRVVSRSWADVRASEVIDYLRRQMGLSADYLELPQDVRYARGHNVEGPARRELETVVADCGATYSIEGASLRVYPEGGSVPRAADAWTPGSGLLEIVGPEGSGEVRAMALLRPALRPGDTVPVRSPRWDGDVRVQEVRHDGQSDETRWQTEIVGVAA